jgi:hypothetical protein
MRLPMRRKKHRKPMMGQRRMWRTEGMVGLSWEPVMSMGISVSMAPMRMLIRRNNHRTPMMDQRRMWRTESIVLDSGKIGLYISAL